MKWYCILPVILLSLTVYCQPSPLRTFANDTTTSDTLAVAAYTRLSKAIKWRNPARALQYANRALALSQRLGYTQGMATSHNLRGFCFWAFGDNELAIQAAMDALQLARHNHYPLLEAASYYTLALGYRDVGEDDKANESLQRGEVLAKAGNDWELLCSIYNLVGVVQFTKHNTDTALFFYRKAYAIGKTHNVDSVNFARILSNIGECYSAKNPIVSFTYYTSALTLARETDNRIAEASILDVIGHAYLRKKDLVNAESKLLTALAFARALGLRRVIRHAYSGLVDVKLQQGNGDKAVVYLQSYYDVRDSLLNTAKIRQIVDLENRYALQIREQNIKLLEHEKRIQKLWTNLLTISLVFVAILSIGLYGLQTYRHRKNRAMLNLEIDFLTQRYQQTEDRYKSAIVGEEVPVESRDQQLLRKAITLVEDNLADPLFGVEKMADAMHMSRTNLHRKIKAVTGFPPGELIRSIRLRKAAWFIVNRVDTLSQIALMVGFDDYAHFSKTFKKHFGMSPNQYESHEKKSQELS